MKKILIGAHNLDDFLEKDGERLCLGPEHILTPGAKDAARNRGIAILYGRVKEPQVPPGESETAMEGENPCEEDSVEALSRRVVDMLNTRFNVRDEARAEQITLAVIKRLQTKN